MNKEIELDASFRSQPDFERHEPINFPSEDYLMKMRQAGFNDLRQYERATLRSGFPHWSDEFIEEILDRSSAESLSR